MPLSIARLFGLFGVGRGRVTVKQTVEQIIAQLDVIEDNLAELRYRYEKRANELFSKIVAAFRRGDRELAMMYAVEMANVRNVTKTVRALELMVKWVKERLLTVKDMREVMRSLMVFQAALEHVRGQVGSLYPTVAVVVDELSRKVRSFLAETQVSGVSVDVAPAAMTGEILEILNRAMVEAEKWVEREFPKPPVQVQTPRDVIVSALPTPPSGGGERRAAVAVAQGAVARAAPSAAAQAQQQAPRGSERGGEGGSGNGGGDAGSRAQQPSGGGLRVEQRREWRLEEVEKLILQYIREHGGLLNLRDLERRYGVPREVALRALNSLVRKGVIRVAQ